MSEIKRDELVFADIPVDMYLPKILDLPIEYINSEDFPTVGTGKKEVPVQRKDINEYVEVEQVSNAREFKIRYDRMFPDKEIFKNEDGKLDRLYNQVIDIPAYTKTVPMVVGDLNYVLNVYPEFSLIYGAIKQDIYYTEKYKGNIKAFAADIINLVMEHRFRDVVHTMNETTYKIQLDAHIKSREGDNTIVTDFQVTDELNKIIIESAMTYRLISPLLNEYFATLDLPMQDKSEFITDIHMEIIRRLSAPYNIDIDNKIFKIVNPRVRRTRYNHRKIWHYLNGQAKDDRTVTYEIYRQLLNAIINKMRNNYSSISLLDVVIRRKLQFIFRANYLIKYRPFSVSKDSGDDEDDGDSIEREFQRPGNEIDDLTNELAISEYINSRKEDIDVERIAELMNYIHNLNEYQENMLHLFYSSKFKLDKSDKKTKMVLLYLMYLDMYDVENYQFIPNLLISKRIDDPEKESKRFTNMYSPTRIISESRAYQSLIDDYTWTDSIIARHNMFVDYSGVARYTFQTVDNHVVDNLEKNSIVEEMVRFLKTVS